MRKAINEIIKEYYDLKPGGHWFSNDTMRFFSSRLPDYAYLKGDYAYFITSEKDFSGNNRFYSIRKFDRRDGKIDTIGDFNRMTKTEARKELAHNILNWKVKDL